MKSVIPIDVVLVGLTAAILSVACENEPISEDRAYGPAVPADAAPHPIDVRRPQGLGTLTVALPGSAESAEVPCQTCHGPAGDLGSMSMRIRSDVPFHDNIKLTHGNVTCLSCHDAERRDQLRFADGSLLAAEHAIELCTQCHGVQARDYRQGSHGGMNGYWDLRRGPRFRNHCIDCHNPHSPVYTPVLPVFPPRDRYLGHDAESLP